MTAGNLIRSMYRRKSNFQVGATERRGRPRGVQSSQVKGGFKSTPSRECWSGRLQRIIDGSRVFRKEDRYRDREQGGERHVESRI